MSESGRYISHSRNPPSKALALSPSRVLAGSSLSFLTFPPPSTTSEGCRAAISRRDHVFHIVAPLLLAIAVQSTLSDVILEGASFIRKVAKFHGVNDALYDQRRSEPRSEAEKKHPSGPVASDRLHGRVIYDLDRPAECSLKIELNPARPQITRIPQRAAAENRARITNRDNVVVPIRNGLPDSRHHQLGRQGAAQRPPSGAGFAR